MEDPTATMPSAGRALDGVFARVWELTQLVEETNACNLPGCSIKYDSFLTVMWRAVARGYVAHRDATYIAKSLRYGFDAGVRSVVA